MSHFVVIVTGDDIEEQLAPFEESPELGSPYLVFDDETDDLKERWENETHECVRLMDGTLVDKHAEQFRVEKVDPNEPWRSYVWEYPIGSEMVEIPNKEFYKTFEEYAKEYSRYDEEMGLWGYYSNPNAKWDWYQIGGRWTGYFRLKQGVERILGSPGVFEEPAQEQYGDVVHKCDIDIEGLRRDKVNNAARRWNEVHGIIAGREWKTWDQVREMYGIHERDETGRENLDAARKFYNSQDVVNELRAAGYWDPEDYMDTLADYTSSAYHQALAPFALLHEGRWIERGEMGWWGMVADEKDRDTWATEFSKWFDSLPDDTILTAVDCHI